MRAQRCVRLRVQSCRVACGCVPRKRQQGGRKRSARTASPLSPSLRTASPGTPALEPLPREMQRQRRTGLQAAFSRARATQVEACLYKGVQAALAAGVRPVCLCSCASASRLCSCASASALVPLPPPLPPLLTSLHACTYVCICVTACTAH